MDSVFYFILLQIYLTVHKLRTLGSIFSMAYFVLTILTAAEITHLNYTHKHFQNCGISCNTQNFQLQCCSSEINVSPIERVVLFGYSIIICLELHTHILSSSGSALQNPNLVPDFCGNSGLKKTKTIVLYLTLQHLN